MLENYKFTQTNVELEELLEVIHRMICTQLGISFFDYDLFKINETVFVLMFVSDNYRDYVEINEKIQDIINLSNIDFTINNRYIREILVDVSNAASVQIKNKDVHCFFQLKAAHRIIIHT